MHRSGFSDWRPRADKAPLFEDRVSLHIKATVPLVLIRLRLVINRLYEPFERQ
jgi:hypothetical protein